MKAPAILYNGHSITASFNGKPYTITNKQEKFQKAIDAWKQKDWELLMLIFDVPAVVTKYTSGRVSITTAGVLVDGKPLTSLLTSRILASYRSGIPYEYLVAFLNNCAENPSPLAIQELYGFLESGKITITDDGCFLAYRRVDENYLSFHANPNGAKNRNMIGDVVKMDRNLVDANRKQTCSSGLHFCSYSYLSEYHAGKGNIMVVKINPKNVVSIPIDYNNAKGRCCEYEIVDEVCEGDDALASSDVFTVVKDEAGKPSVKPLRDSKGRFCSALEAPLPKRDSKGRFVSA